MYLFIINMARDGFFGMAIRHDSPNSKANTHCKGLIRVWNANSKVNESFLACSQRYEAKGSYHIFLP